MAGSRTITHMRPTEPKWDQKDLERRLCHALDIAIQAIERLAPAGYTDPEEPDGRIRPEKVVSETALLLLTASTVACREAVGTRVRQVAGLLIPHARSRRMRLGLCLEPALALDYATAHICLTRAGYPDICFDELLRTALRSQARAGRERVPHRVLEQEWLLRGCADTPVGLPGVPAMARYSVLNRPMDLLSGSRDDVYAFTHAVMYVRDFNIAPRRLPVARTALLEHAEAALARCLDEQDYDLGAEVLLAWPLTGKAWSPAAAFAFRVMAGVEDQAGFLPTASTRIERLNRLQGESRSAYLLATAYHTVYVMGLLCAMALQPGRTPPRAIPSQSAIPGSARRFLEILDADGRSAHWREEFAHLTEVERDSLAGFLLNVALRRKAGQRDFSGMAKLLAEGHALGLTDTPAASQSAEMLERVAMLAGDARLERTA
jgi:hypothetical protein